MQIIDTAIQFTELALAIIILIPFVRTAFWTLTPHIDHFTAEALVPELDLDLDGEQIIATIERHIPAAAQAITAPVAGLAVEPPQVPNDSEPVQVFNYPVMKVTELRQHCKQSGITWRNAHGKGKHLRKAEMVAALEAA